MQDLRNHIDTLRQKLRKPAQEEQPPLPPAPLVNAVQTIADLEEVLAGLIPPEDEASYLSLYATLLWSEAHLDGDAPAHTMAEALGEGAAFFAQEVEALCAALPQCSPLTAALILRKSGIQESILHMRRASYQIAEDAWKESINLALTSLLPNILPEGWNELPMTRIVINDLAALCSDPRIRSLDDLLEPGCTLGALGSLPVPARAHYRLTLEQESQAEAYLANPAYPAPEETAGTYLRAIVYGAILERFGNTGHRHLGRIKDALAETLGNAGISLLEIPEIADTAHYLKSDLEAMCGATPGCGRKSLAALFKDTGLSGRGK